MRVCRRGMRWATVIAAATALTTPASAGDYSPGAWTGQSAGPFAPGDVCYATNPTCTATSSMDNAGAFSLDNGFALGTAASTNGERPSKAQSVRTLLIRLPFTQANLCDAQARQTLWPTITVTLRNLQVGVTSDGQGDELGSADIWLSMGSLDNVRGGPLLLSQTGTTAYNWSKQFPLASLSDHGVWQQTGLTTLTWANAGVDCFLIPNEADLDITVVTSLKRGRFAASAGRPCVTPVCIEPAIYQPSLTADRITVSGVVAGVTTTFPRKG